MKTINNINFRRDPDFKGVEVCEVTKSCHVFPNHCHDDIYAFSLVEEGGSYCLGKSKDNSLVKSGEIALINPGQVHSGEPVKDVPITYQMIYINLALMKKTASDIYEKESKLPEFTQMVIHDPKLAFLFRQVSGKLIHSSGHLEKDSCISEFLGQLLVEYGLSNTKTNLPGKEHLAVRLAMEYLAENLDQKLPLEEVAKEAGFSRYHFLRIFKKNTGLSPHAFRTQRRIDAARKFLLQGTPLAQIAIETGFTDQSHFTNKFRQYTGATPKQYLDSKN